MEINRINQPGSQQNPLGPDLNSILFLIALFCIIAFYYVSTNTIHF